MGYAKKIFCRRLIWVITVIAVCWLLHWQAGNILLRPLAVKQIRELTEGNAEIGSVNFKLNGSITLNDVAIKTSEELKYGSVPFEAKTVTAWFSWGSIFALQPRLKKITVQDFVLNLVYNSDTECWNIASLKLKRAAKKGQQLPVFLATDGAIKYSRVSGGCLSDIMLSSIEGSLRTIDGVDNAYSFYLGSPDLPRGVSEIKGLWHSGPQGNITLKGRISSVFVPAFASHWTIGDLSAELEYDQDDIVLRQCNFAVGDKTRLSVTGAIRNFSTQPEYEVELEAGDFLLASKETPNAVVYTQEILANFDPSVQKFFSRFKPQGWGDITLKASGTPGRWAESSLTGQIICKDASFCYEKFPYTIEHLTGMIDVADKKFVLHNLQGKHGEAALAINGYSNNFGSEWDCRVQVTSGNMLLDDELYAALSTKLKRLWFVFAPSGLVGIDYRWARHPKTGKKSSLEIELLNVAAACQHFPYPLKNLTGRMFIEQQRAELRDIISRYDGRRVVLNGEVIGIDKEHPKFNIAVNADDIPIDSTLRAALPDRQREFYRHFKIEGLTDVQMKIFSTDDDSRHSVDYVADVELRAKSIIYDKMPLPLTDGLAKAVVTKQMAKIERLTGRCGGGEVSISSKIWTASGNGDTSRYDVSLQAEGIELNEALASVLPEKAAEVLTTLQAEGRINLAGEISKRRGTELPEYKIAIACLGNRVNYEKFSYPLRDIEGRVTITNDRIILEDVTAAGADQIQIGAEGMNVKVNGEIALDNNNGFDRAELSLLAQNVDFDQRLSIVLDGLWPDFYESVSPTGRFDLNVENLKIFKDGNSGRCVDFAGGLRFKKCGFGRAADVLSDLDAIFQVQGLYKAGVGLSQTKGKMQAEGLKFKGKELNHLEANVQYIADRKAWLSKGFVARCYNGRATGNIELAARDGMGCDYRCEISLENVDLGKFLAAAGRDKESRVGDTGRAIANSQTLEKRTKGLLSGWVSVSGQLDDNTTRVGRMRLAIRDMQVGKLSGLGQVVTALQLKSAKDCAFDRMRVNSYIRGNELLLGRVDMLGEGVSMQGVGRMDLVSKQVDLDFTASIGGLTQEPSLLESLAIGLGPAFLRMEVRGDFDNPQIKTTKLPVLEDSLGILGTKAVSD